MDIINQPQLFLYLTPISQKYAIPQSSELVELVGGIIVMFVARF